MEDIVLRERIFQNRENIPGISLKCWDYQQNIKNEFLGSVSTVAISRGNTKLSLHLSISLTLKNNFLELAPKVELYENAPTQRKWAKTRLSGNTWALSSNRWPKHCRCNNTMPRLNLSKLMSRCHAASLSRVVLLHKQTTPINGQTWKLHCFSFRSCKQTFSECYCVNTELFQNKNAIKMHFHLKHSRVNRAFNSLRGLSCTKSLQTALTYTVHLLQNIYTGSCECALPLVPHYMFQTCD